MGCTDMDKILSFKDRKRQEEIELSRTSFTKRLLLRITKSFSGPGAISTYFFCGKLPLAQGTIGSFGAYPIYYITLLSSNSISQLSIRLLFVCMMLILMAVWAIPLYLKKEELEEDDSSIVIDEVIGQLLTISLSASSIATIAALMHGRLEMYIYNFIFILSFFMFRFFDIYKPLGIRFIDKYIKNAIGVILDDVVAALYSSIVIAVMAKIMSWVM